MNVKKSKMDCDLILRDLTILKKQTAEMESKYTNVLQENRLLWQTLMKSKKQQDAMKQQMERVCRFLYKVYPGNRLRDTGDDSTQFVISAMAIDSQMLQDKPHNLDSEVGDYSMLNDDGLMTPDQYNSSLEYPCVLALSRSYLQMNSVPRVDSPRNMPLRPLDFGRPAMSRMLTNGSQGSLQTVRVSLLSDA